MRRQMTAGGPNGGDDLPPLPDGLRGLRGVALLRAAHATTRRTEPPRTWTGPTRATRRDTGREDLRPDSTPPLEAWTPSSVLDDIPLPDEPPEDDWRSP